MDVTPSSNLPAISQPWGRWVDKNVVNLSVDAARLRLDSLNQNKQLNSSFGLLSGQVATLSSQQAELATAQAELTAQQALLAQIRTYSATGGESSRSGAGTAVFVNVPTLSFTVDRDMRVLVTVTCPWVGQVQYVGQVTLVAHVDGAEIGNSTDTSTGAYGTTGQTTPASGTTLVTRSIVVAAGAHTLSLAAASDIRLTGGGGGGYTAGMYASPVTLTAAVTGPA